MKIAESILAPKPGSKPQEVQEAPDSELPEGYRVLTTGKDHELGQSETPGIKYQKCGGGRRIIRKSL